MKQLVKEVQQSNIKLVRAVKKHRCLYDASVPEYSLKAHTLRNWELVARETGIAANDCRVRWRNLRISFLRYLRQARSERKKNLKPYYLLNEMAFMESHVRHGDRDFAGLADGGRIEYEVESQEGESLVFTIKGDPSRGRDKSGTNQLVTVDDAVDDIVEEEEEDEEEEQEEQLTTTTMRTINIKQEQSSAAVANKQQSPGPLHHLQQQEPAGNVTDQQLFMELNHPDLAFFRSILPDVESMTMGQKSKFKLSVLTSLNEILYG